MKRKVKNKYFYAAYRGDHVIAVGTADELAKVFGVTKRTIRFYATAVYHDRIEDHEKSLLVYKYPIDEGDQDDE